MKLADAVVYLGTEITGLRKGLDQAKAETKAWGGGMATIVQGALMGVGIAVTNGVINLANKAKDAIGDSIGAASDMSETVSKINTLFGDSSNDILKWSDKSAIAMGLSKQAALDAVGTIGNMFMQLGSGAEQAAGLSQEMTQMAADLSSFHNVAGGTPEVLEAMTAGFRGEYDALQRYIPTISAATVEQKALEMTGKATTKELTALEKALAVQAIIMKDAGAATGDFARTSEGLANQQRIADAQTKNLSATIGQALVPIVLTVQSAYNTVLQGAMPAVTAFINDRAVPAMTSLARTVSDLITRLVSGDFQGAWQLVKDLFGNAVEYVTTNLSVWVGKVGEWGVAAWQWIFDAVSQIPAKLADFWSTLTTWFDGNKQKWVDKLNEWGDKLWKWISDTHPQTATNLTNWWGIITKKFDEYRPLLTTEVSEWKVIILGLFGQDTQNKTGQNADSWFGKLVGKMNGTKEFLDTMKIKFATSVVEWLTEAIPATIRAATDWLLSLGKGLNVSQNREGNDALLRAKAELAAAIIKMLLEIRDAFWDSAKRVGAALLDGIKQGWTDNWEGFKAWLMGGLQGITDLLPGSEPKDPTSPLRGLAKRGAALVTNFSSGAESAMAQFKQSITNNLDMVGAGMTGAMGGTIINNYNNSLNLQGSGYAPSDALSAVQLLNMSYRNA